MRCLLCSDALDLLHQSSFGVRIQDLDPTADGADRGCIPGEDLTGHLVDTRRSFYVQLSFLLRVRAGG